MLGHGLALRKETVSVFAKAVQVAEKALLVPAERNKSNRHGNAHVNAYLAAVRISCKLPCIVAALGLDHGAVRVRAGVHNGKTFVKILASLYAKHGTEDLVPADRHIFRYMVKNCGADEVAVFIARRHFGIAPVNNEFSALVNAFWISASTSL